VGLADQEIRIRPSEVGSQAGSRGLWITRLVLIVCIR
jgi:hypothetical protein